MSTDLLYIFWLVVMFIVFVIVPLIKRLKTNDISRLNLVNYRNYLDEGTDIIDATKSGATIMKGGCNVEYRRSKSNGTLNEHVILVNHFKNGSDELILTYIDGNLSVVRINGVNTNPNLSPANYIAAHKILEMGQQAWKIQEQIKNAPI